MKEKHAYWGHGGWKQAICEGERGQLTKTNSTIFQTAECTPNLLVSTRDGLKSQKATRGRSSGEQGTQGQKNKLKGTTNIDRRRGTTREAGKKDNCRYSKRREGTNRGRQA